MERVSRVLSVRRRVCRAGKRVYRVGAMLMLSWLLKRLVPVLGAGIIAHLKQVTPTTRALQCYMSGLFTRPALARVSSFPFPLTAAALTFSFTERMLWGRVPRSLIPAL